ncbi:MAG: glycosyl hydrolase [Terracidiphilus sp.]|jgi:mannan endo-1,4-beta-mannosidase
MRTKSNHLATSLLALLLGCASPALLAQATREPVNPHATPEARALLAYLDSISGKATVTGQHNYPNEGSRWTDLAYDLTGKYPGLFGQDFGFSAGDDKDSVLSRPAMIEEVKRQYQNGAIIALTWHEVRPTDDEPVTFHDSVQGHLTDYEWQQLLTPGTPLNKRWCAQVDVIAGYLRQLRDAHVPVLFRAYHEMNGGWFWWGGRPGKDGSAALYRQIFDRFVNVHHLDNLVWVWNVNAPDPGWPPSAEYYPGPQYADVVTMDIYGEFKQEYYDSMISIAAGKPIALAEVGGLPTPEILNQQPRWAYFMCWSEFIRTGNPLERVISVYHAPRMVNRDDPRLAVPMAAIRKATTDRIGVEPTPEPVSPGASPEAKALLNQLAAASGQSILSGQESDPTSPAAATAAVVQATGKQPAIFASDLGLVPAGSTLAETSKAIVTQAVRAHSAHALVSLSWHPARPTDDSPATTKNQLTDFEWNDLLTPGTALNQRWLQQVDGTAETLRDLEKADIAVLWNPFPESNGANFWWAGRKGVHGSAELYRQLFDRLVNHNGLHNLVWVWEAAAPEFRPGAGATGRGMVSDFFPGYLFTDVLEVRLAQLSTRFPASRLLSEFALDKPIGVELSGDLPAPAALTQNSGFAWFLAAPPAATADSGTRTEALRTLYAAPQIRSLPAPQ